ncbi:MAG: hypothetical protein QW760_08305 [Thermofilaceae archaeon]
MHRKCHFGGVNVKRVFALEAFEWLEKANKVEPASSIALNHVLIIPNKMLASQRFKSYPS